VTTAFDWHRGEITRATPITSAYRNTQPEHAECPAVFLAECGPAFKFDRAFMAWLKATAGMTMGEAVEEWHRRKC
jgi:hypothetical protein